MTSGPDRLWREGTCLTFNSSGFSRIVYSDWGPEDGPVIVCVHGLTGNGHDFDWLAPSLAEDGHRVIAVDMPGRGRSDFLNNAQDYAYHQYVHDLASLLAHLDITEEKSIGWIGISMGGLLGIALAGAPVSPIGRIVINDIGPTLSQPDLNLISQYIGKEYRFTNLEEMTAFMKATRGQTWGALPDELWRKMAENNARALPDGALTYSFDPAINDVFSEQPTGDADLWSSWDAIAIPALILRGENSTLFPQKVAEDMLRRGPGNKSLARLEIIKGCGHVPSLMVPDQIERVRNWFRAGV